MRGRRSIFRGKAGGIRVAGFITRFGAKRFEQARRELGFIFREVMGRRPLAVSDADTIEFLSRGVEDTRAYLAKQQKAETKQPTRST